MATIKGIDISSWQGNIGDLGADIDFVIIKASQGTGYQSPTLAEQRDVARRDGKIVGYYHFADMTDAVAEADHFVAAVGTLQPGEFLALDWEVGGYSNSVDAWCASFISRVHQRTGVIPMLYSNRARIVAGSWEQTRAQNAGLWEAAWGGQLPDGTPWPFVAIWQNSDHGSVQGVAGAVDTDIFEGDRDTLKKYGAGGSISGAPAVNVVTPAPPAPAPQTASTIYVVNPGDTLSGIAAKFGTSYQHLAAINGIANPNLIYAGQRLNVGALAAPETPHTYTVVSGDNLSVIAARHGTTWQVLQSINGLANPNFITPGEVLRLP